MALGEESNSIYGYTSPIPFQLKTLNKNFEVIKKLEKIKANLINIKNEL